jgi:hypothetical protein
MGKLSFYGGRQRVIDFEASKKYDLRQTIAEAHRGWLPEYQ